MAQETEAEMAARFVTDYALALREAGYPALANVLQPNLEPSLVWDLYEEMRENGVPVPPPSLGAYELSPPGGQGA